MGCKNEFVRNTVIIRYDNITQKEDKTKDFLLSNKTRLWHSSNHVLYKTKSKEPRSCPLDLIWLYNPKKSIQLFSFAMHNNFIFKTPSVLYYDKCNRRGLYKIHFYLTALFWGELSWLPLNYLIPLREEAKVVTGLHPPKSSLQRLSPDPYEIISREQIQKSWRGESTEERLRSYWGREGGLHVCGSGCTWVWALTRRPPERRTSSVGG